MQGVPVRIEIGPRDVAEGSCVAARRDRPGKEGKTFGVPLEAGAFVVHLRGLLDDVQASVPQALLVYPVSSSWKMMHARLLASQHAALQALTNA